jgi:7-cyano-7-deazaguanine synthase
MTNKSCLVVFSGGQDSTTCLYWALKKFPKVEALTFSYGQRHSIELDCAASLTERLNVKHHIMNIEPLGIFGANSLTDLSMPVLKDSSFMNSALPNSFVPGRNLVFFTLAASLAAGRNIDNLVTGICEADSSGYPDCRKDFVDSFQMTTRRALGSEKFQLHTPLLNLSKAEIFRLANDLEALESVLWDSHTCYEGKRGSEYKNAWGYGCGKCPACDLRAKGFAEYHQ